MHFLAKILTAPLIFILSLAGYNISTSLESNNTPSLVDQISIGAQNAVAGEVYYLSGSGVSATQTTIDVTKFGYTNPDKTYQKFTMINFGDLGCATIQPSTVGKQEFVSWTGITQNTDGTAQLTGVTRGLERFSPYSASTTLQTNHPGGSQLVISNSPPCFYQNYATLKNNQTFSASNIFNDPPILVNSATSTSQVASIAYVNSVSSAGAATSSASVSGIGYLSTGAQAAAGTYTTNAPRFLSTSISTSTPDIQHGNMIPVTGSTGVLSHRFIATSSSDAPSGYSFTAPITLGGTNIFSGLTKFTNSATTTLSAGLESPFISAQYFVATSTTATSSLPAIRISSTASTTNLVVSNSCIGCVGNSYEQNVGTCTLNGGSPSTCTVTLNCSTNKYVTGGGFGTTTNKGLGSVYRADPYPASFSQFKVDFEGPNAATDIMTGYSICINK